MLRFSLLLTALLCAFIVGAQSAMEVSEEIEWADQKKGEKYREIGFTFENAVYDHPENNLPRFSKSYKCNFRSSSASFNLSDSNFEPVPAAWASELENVLVPEEVEWRAEVKRGGDGFYLVVSVPAVRKNRTTGQYERLVSFSGTASPAGGAFGSGASRAVTYAENSVLAEGEWYKIAIAEDGIHRIDRSLLSDLGVNVNEVNPQDINIYGNGGEMLPYDNSEFRYDDLQKNAIQITGEQDGSFDSGDQILFYGKGPHSWDYVEDEDDPSASGFRHTKHNYSDSAYYFIRVDDTDPSRIQSLASTSQPANQQVTTFDDYQFHELDQVNLVKSGRRFFGEHFDINTNYSFNFPFPNVLPDSGKAWVRVMGRTIGSSSQGAFSTFDISAPGNSLELQVNPTSDFTTADVARSAFANFNFLPNSDNVSVSLSFNKYNPTAQGWLDYITLNVERELRMSGAQMHFRSLEAVGPGNVSEFTIENGSAVTQVWEISDFINPRNVDLESAGNTKSFRLPTDELRQFIAFNSSNYKEPRAVGMVQNQNLHAFENVDMVIVTASRYLDPANELADIHREEGSVVEVVTPDQVYNEFSGGNRDVTAIKMIMKMLYDRAEGDPELEPKHLLLFGDGTYNNKFGLRNNNNLIITFQSLNSVSPVNSYVSDDYFALLDDNESDSGDDMLDIGVGRLSARNLEDAEALVAKIRNYLSENTGFTGEENCASNAGSSTFGSWRNTICFVSDDQDGNGGPSEQIHMTHSEQYADTVYSRHNEYNVNKIYMDAYTQESTPGGERYPEVNEAITRQVENGALLINYVGHGGEKGWAHERVLSIPMIQSWSNFNRLPLFMTATCELSRFDDPSFVSSGELILLNPNGGAIGLLTTTRIVFSFDNNQLARSFYNYALEDESIEDLTLGKISMLTKNGSASSAPNKRNFTLLGDPALKLAYPKEEVYTTEINEQPITAQQDTVKALQEVTITGYVGDANGNKLEDYNGFVYPTVYDKVQEVNVQNNDGGSEFSFPLRSNTLYKGKASVTNGDFSFSFVVPKDIGYNFGSGRVSYYAVEEQGSTDAHGFFEEFQIGGALDSAELDSNGPEVNLYMNDESFAFGGITDESPVLFAKVFDENGINTVGSGIGHDIKAILDEESSNPIILNDYYESELDTYKEGSVRYQMSQLEEGEHTLTLKVWDVQNNSSEAYTEFVVANSAEIALDYVLNYPNPFTTNTQFMFQHNQTCDVLNVQVQVFTISGKLVKSITRTMENHGFQSEPIPWDGKDDFGDNIGKGVYVYRLRVSNPVSGESAEEFEKLVILK
ncbi:type IX secretion system sortase PorU [Halocola ammonii]